MIFKEVVHELSRRLGYQAKDLIDFWKKLGLFEQFLGMKNLSDMFLSK
jgi:hypothetical protein